MQITKIVVGVIMAGAVGIVVFSVRSDFSESPGPRPVPAGTNGAAVVNLKPKEAAQELSFSLLMQTGLDANQHPEYPGQISVLAGKRVRITGFIAPYNDPRKMTKLLLLGSPTGCYFCNPPEINAVVFVRRVPNDPPLSPDGYPYTFEGTLHLCSSDLAETNEMSGFLFILDDAANVSAR